MFKFGVTKFKLEIILPLFFIFVLGIGLRLINLSGNNLVLDFDQLEDQYYTYTLAHDYNPLIIGRAVYGNPNLHHGVFYYYYNLIPFLISGGNFFASAYWNIFVNAISSIVIFILGKLIFNKTSTSLIAAFISSVSFEFIKFSNWLTIDTPVIFLVPLFFLGLWGFYKNKSWGIFLAAISMGLSIQSDLSLIYLGPVAIIFLAVFKPKLPSPKIFIASLLLFFLSILTLVLTEIKLQFAGVKSLINFSDTFSGAARLSLDQRFTLFLEDFFKNFSSNLFPQRLDLGIYLGSLIILIGLYFLASGKTVRDEKKGIIFLLLYLFSPAVTLILGYHDTPWFLIGLPGAIALFTGYVISKLKVFLIVPLLLIIGFSNISTIFGKSNEAYKLFDSFYDPTSYLAYQLDVLDYVYHQSKGEPFAINAVSQPLYYNGLWAYLFSWYGKDNYGYIPTWLGGDLTYPYDLLSKSDGREKTFYMIISKTPKVQIWFKDAGKTWALKNGKLIEENNMKGFTVLKMERFKEKGK